MSAMVCVEVREEGGGQGVANAYVTVYSAGVVCVNVYAYTLLLDHVSQKYLLFAVY